MNSRAKGKRGELEARDMVRKLWHSPACTRSAQHCGKEASDLMGGPPGLHIEVKLQKSLAVYKFMDQAVRDKRAAETPVVLMRGNGREWLVMFRMEDTDGFCVAMETAMELVDGSWVS